MQGSAGGRAAAAQCLLHLGLAKVRSPLPTPSMRTGQGRHHHRVQMRRTQRLLSGRSAHARLTGNLPEISHESMTIGDSEISESALY